MKTQSELSQQFKILALVKSMKSVKIRAKKSTGFTKIITFVLVSQNGEN